MLKILKKSLKSRQKKEKKFEKSFTRLEATAEKYIKIIQK